MQFKKTILSIFMGLLANQAILCTPTKEEAPKIVAIKQVSEKRIEDYAQKLSKSIWRNNLLVKSLLLGGGALGIYELYSILTSGKHRNQSNEQRMQRFDERIANLERLQQNAGQGQQAPPQNPAPAPENNNASWMNSLKGSSKLMVSIAGMTVLQNIISHVGNKIFSNVIGTNSIDAFDKHSAHCDNLLEYLVHTIKEIAEFINKTGQSIKIDKEDFAMTCNRLITRVENVIGYVRAKRMKFKDALGIEAENLEKRLIEYATELAEDLHDVLEETDTDYMELAQVVARFGQRYGQEKQRFALIEEDAKA